MKFTWKHLRNDSGLSMTELLVAAAIGVILLGASIYVFTKQEETLRTENQTSDLRGKGRHAVKVLAKELRMAGFGLPPNQGLTAVSSTSVSYRANLDQVRTTTPPGSPGTKAISSGSNSITVVDGSEFSNGDKIVLYDPAFGTSELNTVSGSPGSTSIPLGTSASNDFTYAKNAKLVTVNKYNDVTIGQVGDTIVKTIDSGSPIPLIGKVASGGLEFAFYKTVDHDDSTSETTTTPSEVRKIVVTVRLEDPDDASLTQAFKTDVTIRN